MRMGHRFYMLYNREFSRITLKNWKSSALSRWGRVILLAGCILGQAAQQVHASDWKLVQQNIGAKTFSVNLTLRAKTTIGFDYMVGEDYFYMPSGATVGTASVTLPGAGSIGTSARIDKLWNWETYEEYWGPVFRIIDFSVQDFATGTTRRCQLVSQADDVQFSVSVSGQADRYARIIESGSSAPWRLGIGRRNQAADIMSETNVEYKDVMDHPTVTISLGGQSFSYTSTATGITENSIQISASGGRPSSPAPWEHDSEGYWIIPSTNAYASENDGAYNCSGTTWVDGTYSRSTGVAEEARTFSFTQDIPEFNSDESSNWWTTPHPVYNGIHAPGIPGGTLTRRATVTVGGGHVSCSGGYDGGSGDGWNSVWYGSDSPIYAHFDFTDYCGKYDVNYARDIKNMDGSPRTDIHVMGHEQHPTEHMEPVTGLQSGVTVGHSMRTYTWDNNYIDLSSGPTIHYGGRWSVNAYMPGASQQYIDLPYDVATGVINHGDLTADNIQDTWNQGTSNYVNNSPGEPSHPGWQPWPDQRYDDDTGQPLFATNGEPIWACGETENGCPWYDNQVLVKGGWNVSNAFQINLASPGDIPNPPLNFYNLNGWTITGGTIDKVSPYLVVTTPTSGVATAEIADLLPESIRLTGTRFAKVRWYSSRDNAKAVISIGGHSWNLKAGAAGTQTTLIDLCAPDESTVPGNTSTTKEETAIVDQTLESPHPITGSYGDPAWVGTYSAPNGAKTVRFHVDQIEAGYWGVDVYDADTNEYLGYINATGDTEWFTAKNYRFEIWLWESQQAYGLKITQVEYTYDAPVSIEVSKMQSIIQFDQPVDASLYDDQLSHGKRQPDSYYSWEYPASWGVGRVVGVKLECKTPDTEYKFQCLQLYRKTTEEGGFAKLYVLPHQPSWNDSRQLNDWSWFDSGTMALPWCTNYRYVIRKAHLVIDGAVVLEIPAGTCEQDNHPQTGYEHPTPWYIFSPWKLLPNEGATGMHVLAYPVNDYANPTSYATNGVAGIDVNLAQANDFVRDNCYVTYLVGGTYSEAADHTIKVALDITPDAISPYIGSFGTVAQGMTKRLRGGVQGLAFQEDGKPAANRQIRVTTPEALSNQKTDTAVLANALGWFETPALNTKSDAMLETCVGTAYSVVRNRFLSRIAVTPLGLGDSTFELTDVSPFVVEPAYADVVNIRWRRTDGQSTAQSILILRRNDSGAVVGSDGVRYDLIATIALGQSGQEVENPAWNPPSNSYRWLGSATWQPPTNQAPGQYDVGVLYDDSTVQTKWGTGEESCWPGFNVAVSVYDVYSDVSAPFYPAEKQQNVTTIHYTLSANVSNCALTTDGVIISGTALDGENSVNWNGKDANGKCVDTGQIPVDFATVPQCGPSLQFSGISSDESFAPEDGDSLQINYTLAEPVVRPQATEAYLDALVVDNMTGQVVKVLADASTINIDNDLTGPDTGSNSLTWDGTDESGENFVDPGNYTITLFAKDNAGAGCESRLTTIDVEVLPGDQGCVLEANASSNEDQTSISGFTNSGASITWSDSNGGQGSASPDQDGDFDFSISNTPGLHTITLTTIDQQTQETKQETAGVFINSMTLDSVETSPTPPPLGETGRFNPSQGQSLNVTFTTDASDTFNVEVIDPFDCPTCIASSDPVLASEFLNGYVTPRPIRTIWDKHQVNAGQCTFAWDGKDDNAVSVPAGPYFIYVSRSNEDGLRSIYFDVAATVDSTGTAPIISDVSTSVNGTSVAIAWKTNVPTTGAVFYSNEEAPVARAMVSDLSCFHVAYLPITEPGTTYTYWIVAKDDAGNTAVSQKQTVVTGQGESFTDVTVIPVSDTAVDIRWTSPTIRSGRVRCALVGPSISTLDWQVVDESTATTDHIVHLTGLSENNEYVFRVASASSSSFTDASVSRYMSFVTKQTKPSVVIESPDQNESVSGTVSVTVRASDTVHRFLANGITNVELRIDGDPVDVTSHTPGSDEYTFRVDTSQLDVGFHQLIASATDDFWNTSTYITDIYVEHEQGTQMSAMSMMGPLGAIKDKIRYKRSVSARHRIPALPRGNNIALILLCSGWDGPNWHEWPPKPIGDAWSKKVASTCAKTEYGKYKAQGYKPVILLGSDFGSSLDCEQFFVRHYHGRLKSFSYIGHGWDGELYADANVIVNALELHDEHVSYHNTHPRAASRIYRLKNMRLFSCHSRRPYNDINTGKDYHLCVEAVNVGRCRVPKKTVTYNRVVNPATLWSEVKANGVEP